MLHLHDQSIGARDLRVRDTTGRGDLTELHVAAALMSVGKRVLRPLSNGSRYDLLVDNENGTFFRIQCKTGVLREGSVVFRACSVNGRTARSASYVGEIDAFGIYCPQTRGAYLVPIADVSHCKTKVYLRVEPVRNGQRRGVRNASDFLIDV